MKNLQRLLLIWGDIFVLGLFIQGQNENANPIIAPPSREVNTEKSAMSPSFTHNVIWAEI